MAPIHEGDFGPFSGSDADAVVFGTYRRSGTWSPELVALISRLLGGDGGTLIDVGANLGLVAIPVLEATRARAIVFEPAPDNLSHLRRNVALHGVQARIELHATALAERAAELTLALSPDNSGDHRLRPSAAAGASGVGAVRVEVQTLDGVVDGRELARPCVLKVDTQGAEARVLAGAARTLAQVDYLIVEYWPAGLHRMGDRVEALREALRSFSHAVVLDPTRPPERLAPSGEVLDSLAWIPEDGSDEGFFDLLLAHGPSLPDARL